MVPWIWFRGLSSSGHHSSPNGLKALRRCHLLVDLNAGLLRILAYQFLGDIKNVLKERLQGRLSDGFPVWSANFCDEREFVE